MRELTVTQMGLVVLISQIFFLWFRTLNIRYTTSGNVIGAVLTGNGIGVMWMIGIAVGANAMMEGHWFPIAMHLLGGTLGTVIGMRKKKK